MPDMPAFPGAFTVRETLKTIVRGVAVIFVLPWVLLYKIKTIFLDSDKALLGSSQALAMIPGLTGQYLRRAFLGFVLVECHKTAVIEFGVLFSKVGTKIGENAYIGPYSQIGLADIGRDVLIAPAVHIPSGAAIHGTSKTDIPIRDQEGVVRMVRIGAGSWIGSGSVVMADVGKGCVIGAGSVVTKPIPDLVTAAGIPAETVRSRVVSVSDS